MDTTTGSGMPADKTENEEKHPGDEMVDEPIDKPTTFRVDSYHLNVGIGDSAVHVLVAVAMARSKQKRSCGSTPRLE
jgi:hypothetical protein